MSLNLSVFDRIALNIERAIFSAETRVFLYRDAAPGTRTGLEPLTDLNGTGELTDAEGFNPNSRFLGLGENNEAVSVTVAMQGALTPAIVADVAGFLVVRRGEATGVLHRVTKPGVPDLETDATIRFTSAARVDVAASLPASAAGFPYTFPMEWAA
jgi:hypothetical protein